MLNLRKVFRNCVPAVCAVGLWQGGAFAGDDAATLRTYQSPDGSSYGSISIRSGQPQQIARAMNHVVLIDTSASQIGSHREQGFKVLEALLKALPAQDKVAVLAIDVQPVAMTEGMQSPDEARTIAMQRLSERFPAGSTDILAGLTAAQELLAGDVPGGIIYIGDGMSAAHLIQFDEIQLLTNQLRQSRTPVHSFAVGSNTDMQLLGVLGQETGGYVMRDENSDQSLSGEQVGELLASAAHLEIVYPTAVTLGNTSLLPSRALPLRADRETVYLFEGSIEPGVSLTLQERAAVRSFAVTAPVRETGNTFLKHLYQNNQANDGVALGLAADWMVNLAHETFEGQVALLETQGQQALAVGNTAEAERIGFALQTADPNNARSRALINAAGAAQIMQVAQVAAEPATDDAATPEPADPNAVEAPGTAPPLPATNPAIGEERVAPRNVSGIDQYVEARAAKGAKLTQQVQQGIDDARRIFTASPDAGISQLEKIRGNIKSASDIEPELREQLLRRVNGDLLQFQTKKEQQAALNAQKLVRRAETEAHAALIDYQANRDEQLEQMVNRIRALMDDGFHGDRDAFEQAEAGARQVINAYPHSAIGTAVVFTTEAAGQLDKVDRLRQLRADRYLEVLYQVELSHVPYPDEPPIRYPSAEVWQALTELRAKWKSVDLHRSNDNERRIYEALDDTTSLEFPSNPLSDVVQYIETLHSIPIRLDEAGLTAEGIGPDTEVKMVVSGISLKSALKLMLEDVGGVQLTYIIEDEVMKITTQTKADEELQTRVYPVADLVIPVQPLGGGFGGGLGGGLGQQQGGQGGLGGGQQGGGFGGGQQGGGFGGGGGFGQFQIPAQPVPAFDATEIQNAKKKGE